MSQSISSCLHKGSSLIFVAAILVVQPTAEPTLASDGLPVAPRVGDPDRGYQLLTEKAYLPADFDERVFEQLWQVWPEPDRSRARNADPLERRQLTFERYGITARPNNPDMPLQYVVASDGSWSMNCFACHGGHVDGCIVPGLPNSDFALAALTSDVRATKLRLGKPLGHMDLGSLVMPLGGTRGTTNAVMFGVALLAYRDDDLNLLGARLPPKMTHHDMDAPPWWHFAQKHHMYIDGFAPKGHRALMQFMLVEQNGPQQFRSWEDDFRHVNAYLNSLKPPAYTGPIDRQLAADGQIVFEASCAECHGSNAQPYPERCVPWDQIRTDRVRLEALTPLHRQRFATSWFNTQDPSETVLDPAGYVAPPLDGIWASAPYLHNGSVPTLWHLLRPDQRPRVWRKSSSDYDHQRMGLSVDTFDDVPQSVPRSERFEIFDTSQRGKSAAGHDFPAKLNVVELRAVLEFLKTR